MAGRLDGTKNLTARVFGVLALLVALAVGLVEPASAQSEPIQIIATNSITGDLVRNVAGDHASVVVLVAANGDSHTYEPTPDDAGAIADASLVFENGLGLEPWLDDVFEASGSTGDRVVVTDQITPLRIAEEGDVAGVEATPVGEAAPAPAEGGDHAAEGEFDPHVWFDVANVKLMVSTIAAALVAADPANATSYEANAAVYHGQLDELDRYVLAQVETLPVDARRLVTSHDTFAYFARRYGFEIVGAALSSVTTESADPSAAEIAALVDTIVAAGVPAIFPENVSNPALLDQIASEADVVVGPELYTDALGDPDGEAGTYMELMRYDVTAIVTALHG